MEEKKMMFKIVYGSYEGLEKKALEVISQTVFDYVDYTLPAVKADSVDESSLKDHNLILIGTEKSNHILKKLSESGVYSPADREEGYSIKVMKSCYNENAQMVIISGFDDAGVLYGAVDFKAYYIPHATNGYSFRKYIKDIFNSDELVEYEKKSAPAIKNRGLWSWGHVIYDYNKYIEHMMHLKMNTLIVWNDFVPVNIRDIIKKAHECGVKIYLGYSWGWKGEGVIKLDISSQEVLDRLSAKIVAEYEECYADLDIDGIYFQSFTETKDDKRNGVLIAERVVSLVNQTSKAVLEKHPELCLMFGLHATSVNEKLEYIQKTDERVMIVWEDGGAFPYAYTPYETENFDEMMDFTKKIVKLRGEKERFGVVTKGLICLDWSRFEFQTGPYVMGCHSKEFIEERTAKRGKIWEHVSAFWLKNGNYCYDYIKLLGAEKSDSLVVGLVEDGLFEQKIWLPVALYGEMLWDCSKDFSDLLTSVSLRADVE